MLLPKLCCPVGNNRTNQDDDVLNLKWAFKALGRMREPEGGFIGIIDTPLVKAIEDYQTNKGLLMDGMLNPGGETERNVRRNLGLGPKDKPFDPALLELTSPVGDGQRNSTNDL